MIDWFTTQTWGTQVVMIVCLWLSLGAIVTAIRSLKGPLHDVLLRMAERHLYLSMLMMLVQILLWPTKLAGAKLVVAVLEKYYRYTTRKKESKYFRQRQASKARGFNHTTGYDPTDFGGFHLHDLLEEELRDYQDSKKPSLTSKDRKRK